MGSLFSKSKRVHVQPSVSDSVLGDPAGSARSSSQPLSDRGHGLISHDAIGLMSNSQSNQRRRLNNEPPVDNAPITSARLPNAVDSPSAVVHAAAADLSHLSEDDGVGLSLVGQPLNDNYYDENERVALEKSFTFQSNQQTAAGAAIQFRKGELLGYGAYGQVFLGLNVSTGELLAVKEVPVLSAKSKQSESALRALEKEIALMSELSHPNIVRYLGTQRTESSLNIFLEFVPGGSIASLLKRFGKFNEMLIRVYCQQILLGLEYLHSHQIIHRDIKGGNILVGTHSTPNSSAPIVKLADFGAATRLANLSENCGPKSLHGSPYWMAPEVVKQTGHGRQADIWSVGCTVIEMATGKPPWTEFNSPFTTMMHIAATDQMPPLPDHLSEEAKHFLICCLQRDPQQRPNATRLLSHPFITGSALESGLTDSIDLTGLLAQVSEEAFRARDQPQAQPSSAAASPSEADKDRRIEVLRDSPSNSHSPADTGSASSIDLPHNPVSVVSQPTKEGALAASPLGKVLVIREGSVETGNSAEFTDLQNKMQEESAANEAQRQQQQQTPVVRRVTAPPPVEVPDQPFTGLRSAPSTAPAQPDSHSHSHSLFPLLHSVKLPSQNQRYKMADWEAEVESPMPNQQFPAHSAELNNARHTPPTPDALQTGGPTGWTDQVGELDRDRDRDREGSSNSSSKKAKVRITRNKPTSSHSTSTIGAAIQQQSEVKAE